VKAQRRDTRSGRFYQIDGESYPSVTTILGCIGKPALIQWAANQERTLVTDTAARLYEELASIGQAIPRSAFLVTLEGRCGKERAHRRELEKAGDIGTQAHALIEWHLRRDLGLQVGVEPNVCAEALWAFMAFQDWAKSVDLKPKYIEQTVFSSAHRYAGTMDLLAEVNGVLTLADFKTGKSIYGEALLQNVAYRAAVMEMGIARPEAGLIVRLPKVQTDPEFEVKPVPPVDALMPTFLAVRQLWTWYHAQEQAYQASRSRKGEAA
jgi:hypothetical protein